MDGNRLKIAELFFYRPYRPPAKWRQLTDGRYGAEKRCAVLIRIRPRHAAPTITDDRLLITGVRGAVTGGLLRDGRDNAERGFFAAWG
jgi:hypothetical protein